MSSLKLRNPLQPADYGMLSVLFLLAVACSLGTIRKQDPKGKDAARIVAREISESDDRSAPVVILSEDAQFVEALDRRLGDSGFNVVASSAGEPPQLRRTLEGLASAD